MQKKIYNIKHVDDERDERETEKEGLSAIAMAIAGAGSEIVITRALFCVQGDLGWRQSANQKSRRFPRKSRFQK